MKRCLHIDPRSLIAILGGNWLPLDSQVVGIGIGGFTGISGSIDIWIESEDFEEGQPECLATITFPFEEAKHGNRTQTESTAG